MRPEAIDHGCPPMYADPPHDPRMQQLPAARQSRRLPKLVVLAGFRGIFST
jgi:hypothetical protein